MELDCLRLWQEACMQRELALVAATKSATEGSMVLQGAYVAYHTKFVLYGGWYSIQTIPFVSQAPSPPLCAYHEL